MQALQQQVKPFSPVGQLFLFKHFATIGKVLGIIQRNPTYP